MVYKLAPSIFFLSLLLHPQLPVILYTHIKTLRLSCSSQVDDHWLLCNKALLSWIKWLPLAVFFVLSLYVFSSLSMSWLKGIRLPLAIFASQGFKRSLLHLTADCQTVVAESALWDKRKIQKTKYEKNLSENRQWNANSNCIISITFWKSLMV